MSEILKYCYNNNMQPSIYFWRDVQGHEIDILIEKSINEIIPLEVKSGMTISPEFFHGLEDWQDITEQERSSSYVVYCGQESLLYKGKQVISWNDIPTMLKSIYNKSD